MSSNFYIFHHELKAGSSSKWRDTAYAAMTPGGGYDNSVIPNKVKGFYNHSDNAITKEVPFTVFGRQRKRHLLKNFKNS